MAKLCSVVYICWDQREKPPPAPSSFWLNCRAQAEFTEGGVAPTYYYKLAFKLICDFKVNPILNLLTPLLNLFLSSYCQFQPCFTFAADKTMALNLGALRRPLENSSLEPRKECGKIV